MATESSGIGVSPEPGGVLPPSLPPDSPVDTLYAELLNKVREVRPRDDLAPLEHAFRFASENHKLQTRDSGEPYMVHPLMVAHILADMRMDLVSLETGLLHDVVEDTSVTVADIRKNFGEDVARCVDGVTKLSKLDFFSAEERQAESFRKMLLAMVNDIRVIIVKLADRQHNMRTLGFIQNAERRERIARETIEIYAPIAHRLGMGKIRGELEDLAFRHIDPAACEEVTKVVESGRHANEESLNGMRQRIEAELRREGIPARVDSRLKRPYSIYQKMKRQKITIEQVYDLMAVRIITDSVKNCYARAGSDPQRMAAGAGAHQGLHRHSASEPVPVAAHVGGGSGGQALRDTNPDRRDASCRGGRHRGALEIQGGQEGAGGR